MNLETIRQHLTAPQFDRLAAEVARLEAAIAAGRVPNILFTEAKFHINRRIEEAVDSFDDANGRRWHNVNISGAYNLPAALKDKSNSDARRAFVAALLPLHELLQAAKPLIIKRGAPGTPPSAKQIERDAEAMTCQCCGRDILANLGTIALHGYERPGYGNQTGSCMGAKYLPFEVDRKRLGTMIAGLKENLAGQKAQRVRVAVEKQAIEVEWSVYDSTVINPRGYKGGYIKHKVAVTRATFAGLWAEHKIAEHRRERSFYDIKEHELAVRDRAIELMTQAIEAEQKRFDGWKQSHRRDGNQWIAIECQAVPS